MADEKPVKKADIGIGAGPYCDGQNLVVHDMVGLFDRIMPKFVERYANCRDLISKALADFQEDVKSGGFPKAEHSFTMKRGRISQPPAAVARLLMTCAHRFRGAVAMAVY